MDTEDFRRRIQGMGSVGNDTRGKGGQRDRTGILGVSDVGWLVEKETAGTGR